MISFDKGIILIGQLTIQEITNPLICSKLQEKNQSAVFKRVSKLVLHILTLSDWLKKHAPLLIQSQVKPKPIVKEKKKKKAVLES